jgi:peptidylprolyl isomerase
MKIQNGSKVKIQYIGKFEDGNVFDTNKDAQPLEFEVGAHVVIPGFENKIIGMAKGESKTITLTPEEGYGPVNDALFAEIPKEMLAMKGLTDPKPGMKLVMQPKDSSKGAGIATIKEVKDAVVVLDLNHPLAGKTLMFDITVLDIIGSEKPAEKKESAEAKKEPAKKTKAKK